MSKLEKLIILKSFYKSYKNNNRNEIDMINDTGLTPYKIKIILRKEGLIWKRERRIQWINLI
jgi:hypothetical protein